jgi:hypothetical protein
MNAVQKTSIAAQKADLAWTKQLFLSGFKSRWAPGSHGEPGTPLRAAYDAKLAADRANHAAWEADRAMARA